MRISDWSSDVYSSDLTSGATAQESDITIYRCTDAAGHLTVQDSPCADDQSQQVRRMIQPTDPPPRAEPVEPAALQPAPEPRPQPVVVLHAPRPMYECRSEEHTSELQSLMRISYAVFCLKQKKITH